MLNIYRHNEVPDEVKKYLGWANASVDADEVVVYVNDDFTTKRMKPTVEAWLNEKQPNINRLNSSHFSLLFTMNMADAAWMRLDLA